LLPRNTAPVGWIGVGSQEYANAAAQYQGFIDLILEIFS
jgi:hypothetical protein